MHEIDFNNKNYIAQVTAVLVIYEPDMVVLQEALQLIAPQVGRVILVDNASSNIDITSFVSQLNFNNIELIDLPQNYGLAYAQNRGIDDAKAGGAQFILLMDQDSLPAPNMVYSLHAALVKLPQAAVVGPSYTSYHQIASANFTPNLGWKRIRQTLDAEHPILPVDTLIASGSLIPMRVLDVVGKMDERLFIDSIDIEWCLRARSNGFLSYMLWDAKMKHHLGDGVISIFGRSMAFHSPLRRYYQYRNSVLLYKMKHISLSWKIRDATHLIARMLICAVVKAPRVQQAKMMLKGLWDGVLGKVGKLNE